MLNLEPLRASALPAQPVFSAEDLPSALATVRRIIERHGGKVWAEGTPGEGATISFSLERTAHH
jgi:light-regulated signal transduction histidine kinase (bacteriophytochrome)